jgi:hypothetical protein
MSRRTKFISLAFLVLFLLACSTVTQPFKDVQNLAGTAESFATAMPVDTLKALASEIPVSTLEALPSVLPSGMPDFQGYVDPQGTPAADWKGIPIMPQATAGEEAKDGSSYSFKVDASVKDAQDFYTSELTKLGWSSSFSMPGNETASVSAYQKDNNILTVTIMNVSGSVVVILTMG